MYKRQGLHREALAAEPKAFGRYEAAAPNDRWITDVVRHKGRVLGERVVQARGCKRQVYVSA